MKPLRNGRRSALIISCWAAAMMAGSARGMAEDRPTAEVTGSDARVSFICQDSRLLLNTDEVATAFGWKADLVAEGRMLTLCRDGANGLCVPLRLSHVTSIKSETALFVEADALARALRFRVRDVGGVVTLVPGAQESAEDSATPGYNTDWGEGRGFRVGQTLPDIPLIDLRGHEIRFSQFLGRQYIIYCWASW